MVGILCGNDAEVMQWYCSIYKRPLAKVDLAWGLIQPDGTLVGAILFHFFNGHNIELSYFGPKTITPGIVGCVFKFLVEHLDVARCTVTLNKRNKRFARSLERFGFKFESTMRCYYGKEDTNSNAASRYVMFRERMEQLARYRCTDKIYHLRSTGRHLN